MFILEYLKNPKTIGAIAPSSKYLAEKMVADIDFEKVKCIVEYGPGTGVFTEKILARVGQDTKILLIETNIIFYNQLKKIYGHKENVIILNESAENIDKILLENGMGHVDYIVSGIPFTSLPKDVSDNILKKTKTVIKEKGYFVTFQYSLVKLNLFQRKFNHVNITKVSRNFPPAYVLTCKEGVSYE